MTTTNEIRVDQSAQSRSPSVAARYTILLSVALVFVCILVLSAGHLATGPQDHHILSWWAIAPIAAIAQFMVFDVEVRRETYTFTFSEIPLLLGLFLASPLQLVLGRLLGEALFLALREKQPPRKMALNLASFFAETTTMLAVYRFLGASSEIVRPINWLAALASVGAADLVGYVVVFCVVRWHGAPMAFRQILGVAALAIPVNASFALVVGILVVEQPWATLLLLGVAAFLMLAYRAYSSLHQRFESLALLYDFTRLVSGAQRPDAVLEAMLGQAKDLLRAEHAEIWVRDEGTALLRMRVDDNGRTSGEVNDELAAMVESWFLANPGTTVVSRTTADAQVAAVATVLDARDCIIAPITESGSVVGLVAVVNRLGEVNNFGANDRTMFATLANHASIALENGRLIDRLHRQARDREREALHDSLTGLPNRVLFLKHLYDRLEQGERADQVVAVAVMDLDGFKDINDTLGHHSGDIVLTEVARRLSYAGEDSTIVARLGGDEFALLAAVGSDRRCLEQMSQRIREEVSRPLTIDGVRVNLNISIGFALAPQDANEAHGLLQRADVAMYAAKAGTGNGVAFYDAMRDENSPRRLTLASDLRSAIEGGQLRVVYQPKTRLSDGTVVGFEALVRWIHPELGNIPPDEFIPLAERTSTIIELTRFVLDTAFRDAASWARAGRSWSVAVNVAMRNLLDDNFVSIVQQLITQSGCDANLVTLEITESSVMSDATRTIEVLHQLADLGVQLSVDDFGTGYSSLSYLQQLPVAEIKIDKFFVLAMTDDANAEAIVRSIVDLARNLGLRVVAEGVETREAWIRLGHLGCDIGQGYLMSRPMPATEIPHWFRRWPAAASELATRSPRLPAERPIRERLELLAVSPT